MDIYKTNEERFGKPFPECLKEGQATIDMASVTMVEALLMHTFENSDSMTKGQLRTEVRRILSAVARGLDVEEKHLLQQIRDKCTAAFKMR